MSLKEWEERTGRQTKEEYTYTAEEGKASNSNDIKKEALTYLEGRRGKKGFQKAHVVTTSFSEEGKDHI